MIQAAEFAVVPAYAGVILKKDYIDKDGQSSPRICRSDPWAN